MTVQFAVSTRNARLNAIQTEIGTSPVLKILSGSPPLNCASTDTEDVLATMTLPSTWMLSADNGSISKNGTWEDISADLSGIAGHFRIFDSGGTVCHIQGTITATDGGGDMELDSVNITSGQNIIVTTFTVIDGNS